MLLNRLLSLKRINCVDSLTRFGSFNSSYAVKTQDLPEQIEGDLEASLCFGGTNNKVQVCAFFEWNLELFLKQVWRLIGRFCPTFSFNITLSGQMMLYCSNLVETSSIERQQQEATMLITFTRFSSIIWCKLYFPYNLFTLDTNPNISLGLPARKLSWPGTPGACFSKGTVTQSGPKSSTFPN